MYLEENHSIIIDDEMFDLRDNDKFPIIDISPLEDIFLMEKINEKYRNKYFDHYSFNGMGVPRVTHILEACIDKSNLIYWGARIGTEEMQRVKREATEVGSKVHEMIEHYLTTGEDLDLSYKTPKSYMDKINMCYSNFKNWIKYLNSLGYYIEEVIAIELPVICHLYGGTIDAILKINGKIYIVDFKTSKTISYEYIIQTISYYWAVNNGYAKDLPHIDGIGIIRMDKTNPVFEDYFLNEHIPYQREILNSFISGWGAILSCYYNNINLRLLFSSYKKVYNLKEVLR